MGLLLIIFKQAGIRTAKTASEILLRFFLISEIALQTNAVIAVVTCQYF
jgi:hypothetical protein